MTVSCFHMVKEDNFKKGPVLSLFYHRQPQADIALYKEKKNVCKLQCWFHPGV